MKDPSGSTGVFALVGRGSYWFHPQPLARRTRASGKDLHEKSPDRSFPARHRHARPWPRRLQAGGQPGDRNGRIRRHRTRHPAVVDGRFGQAGRRLQPLRQRWLAQGDRDPGRPLERRRALDRRPAAREEPRRADRRPRELAARSGHRRGAGQGVLRCVPRYRNDRQARHDADPGRSAAHRRDPGQDRAGARARGLGPRRRRPVQRDQLLHREPVRRVRHPGADRRGGDPVYPAGRPRHARARVLPLVRAGDGGPPHRVPQVHRRRVRRGGPVRRPGAGAARLRSRDEDRPRACLARGERQLGAGQAAVDAGRLRQKGAGARLAGVLRRRAARQPAALWRVPLGRDPQARRAGRLRAARQLEGLDDLPPDQQERLGAAEQVRQAVASPSTAPS